MKGLHIITVLLAALAVPLHALSSPGVEVTGRRQLLAPTPYSSLVSQLNNASISSIILRSNVTLEGPLPVVSRSLTLEGRCSWGPCQIDGRGLYGLLSFYNEVEGSPLSIFLKNIALVNGLGGQGGGALWISGAVGLKALEVTFQNNSGGATASASPSLGGAVYYTGWYLENPATYIDAPAPSGQLTFVRCEFIKNSALDGGGAIYFEGPQKLLSISNCTFEGNTLGIGQGKLGGSAVLSRGPTSISSSSFTNNKGGSAGGAVRVTGDLYEDVGAQMKILGVVNFVTAVIAGSTFSGNSAPAVLLSNLTAASICRNSFSGPNTTVRLLVANYTVQATFCPQLPSRASIVCPPSNSKCTGVLSVTCALDTPACSKSVVPLSEEKKLLLGLLNLSKFISISLTKDINLTRNVFPVATTPWVHNRLLNITGKCKTPQGVARQCIIDGGKKYKSFIIGQSEQQQVEADKGLTATLSGLSLRGALGAAVTAFGGSLTVSDSSFIGNGLVCPAAPTQELWDWCCGGGLQVAAMINKVEQGEVAAKYALIRVIFLNNTATNGGGLCAGRGASGTISQSKFKGNKAVVAGGGIFTSASLWASVAVFESNKAKRGGAITLFGTSDNLVDYFDAATLTVRRSSFTNNSASSLGGAINVASDFNPSVLTFKVCNSTFGGNKAAGAQLQTTNNIAVQTFDTIGGGADATTSFCPAVPSGSGAYTSPSTPSSLKPWSVSCLKACA